MDLSKLSDNDLRALSRKDLNAMSDEGLVFLRQATAPPLTEEEREARQGFGSAFGAGLSQFVTSGLRGAGEILDSETLTEAARRRTLQEQAEPSFIPTTEEDVARGFEEGLLPGAGAAFRQYVSEPAGEMVGSFVAPTAVGLAALPVAGKLGLGALGTFALTGATTALAEFPSALGDTIERMEQEGQPVDMERATAFAIPQAVLYGFGLPGVGVLPRAAQRAFGVQSEELVKRVLAGELTKEQATQQLSGTLANIAKETALASGSGAAIVTGAEALKRQAAGQELTDEEAVDEYMSQALAAGSLGPLFGLPIGGMRRRGERKRVEAAGATREAEVAAEQKTAEEAAAQQAELAKRGLLFEPEDIPSEFAGPPAPKPLSPEEVTAKFNKALEKGDVKEAASVLAQERSPAELTQRVRVLNNQLDELRERNQAAATAGDTAAARALFQQSKTVENELKLMQTALNQVGGPPKTVADLETRRAKLLKDWQREADKGDLQKSQALQEKIDALDAEIAQQRQVGEPDDLFARADFEESRAQALKVQEEARKKAEKEQDDLREQLRDSLERLSDSRLIEGMEDVITRASRNNQDRFARTSDTVTQRDISENQKRIDTIKREMDAAVASGDLTQIPRLRNELAQLLTKARQGRPAEQRTRALDDQRDAVEAVRSNLEELVNRQFEGSGARGAKGAGITRKELAAKVGNAVAEYTEAAVREVNAYRRSKNMQPLTNTEATRLAMDVRGRLEAVVGQGNLAAFRAGDEATRATPRREGVLGSVEGPYSLFPKEETTAPARDVGLSTPPIERQLAQLKQKYLKGPSLRRRAPESEVARAERASGEFRLEGERDVVSPVLRAREGAPKPLTPEERTRIEGRLTRIGRELNKAYEQYDAAARAAPENKEAAVDPKLLKKIDRLEDEYATLEKRRRYGDFEPRPEVVRTREQTLERAEAEARPAEEARLAELERVEPQELQARLDAEKAKRSRVRDTRAIRELEEALKASTERRRTVELMGIPGEGRQQPLFGEKELEPTATVRATPANFLRYLRSGEVKKLREASKDTNESIKKELAELREKIKKGNPQAIEAARAQLDDVSRTIDTLEASLQAVWENSPAKAKARLDKAKEDLKRMRAAKDPLTEVAHKRLVDLRAERAKYRSRLEEMEQPGYIENLVTPDAIREDEARGRPYIKTPIRNEKDIAYYADIKRKRLENGLRSLHDENAKVGRQRVLALNELAGHAEDIKQARDRVTALTRALKEVEEQRGEALKNLDIQRASLTEPLVRLRNEKSALEKQIAQKMTAYEKAVRESGATPEQLEAAERNAAEARARAGASEAVAKRQREEASKARTDTEQARLEAQAQRPRTIARTSKEVVGDKRLQRLIKEDRALIKNEKEKAEPDADRIARLEARVKKNRLRINYLQAQKRLQRELDKPTKDDLKQAAELREQELRAANRKAQKGEPTEQEIKDARETKQQPRDENLIAELQKKIKEYEEAAGGAQEIAITTRTKEGTLLTAKTNDEIASEQAARRAEILDELRGRRISQVENIEGDLTKTERFLAKLIKEHNKLVKQLAAQKKAAAAKKTDAGKARGEERVAQTRELLKKTKDAVSETRESLLSLTQRLNAAKRAVVEERMESGRISEKVIRRSVDKLEKEKKDLETSLEAKGKELAKLDESLKTKKQEPDEAATNARAKLQKEYDTLESKLDVVQSAIEAKQQGLDRIARTLAIKGDEPPRKERKQPLRGAGVKTETYEARVTDYEKFLKQGGKSWRTVDDYEAPEGVFDSSRFRMYETPEAKMSAAEAEAIGRELEKSIPDGIKFESVGFFSDLPEDVKKQLAQNDGVLEGTRVADVVRGFVLPNGDVYIIRNNHISRADLEATYVHELVGHVSADRLLGSEGVNKLSKRIEAMPGGAYGIARELGIEQNLRGAMADMALTIKKMSDEGKPKADIDRAMKNMEIAAARELLAYTAEKRVTENLRQKLGRWYKEIIGVFRDWMRRSGMAELPKVSDADIYNIIRKAQRNYNKNTVGAFRKIDGDVAFRKSASTPNPALDSGIVGTVGKVVPKDQTIGDRIKATASGMQFMHRFVDRFAGLDYIARTAFKDSLEGTQMMYYNRIADQRSNMVANVAASGPVRLVKNEEDGTFQYKSAGKPSLKQVFESLKSAQKEFGNERFTVDTFGTYLAVERAAADKGGLAAGLKKLDLSGKISTAEAQKLLMAGRASEAFQKARKEYRQYNDGLIDLLVDTGRISKEQAKDYKRADYVPYYREREGEIWDVEHNVRVGDIKNQPYLRQLVGGDSAIVNFEVGALQNTYLLTEMALSNVATKNTAFTLQTLGAAEVGKGKGTAGPNVIRFYKDGVEHNARINTRGNALKYEEQLAEMRAKGKANTEQYKKLAALTERARLTEPLLANIPAELIVKGMDGMSLELPLAIKFMQGPANLLRKAVTRNPAYAARIALKDSLYGWVATGSDVKPVVGVLGNLKGAWTGEQPAIKKLQEQGIIGGHVFNGTVDDMRTVALQLSRGQKGWEKLMGKADRLAILADEAARVTLYDGFIKKGMTEMEATLATLEAQNFTKHGFSPSTRYLSTMIPFFNAQIQGLNVFARALAGKSLFEDKLGVQTAALQRGGLLAGGTMLYSVLMQDNEAYKNATQEDRLNYWFVPVPFFDEPVRVPIPFEAGLVFKALPEGIVNAAMEDDRSSDVLKALGKLTLAAVPGSSNLFLPQGAKPLIEIATNTSFFGMRPIEGLRARQVESGYRYGARTTEVSKAIGELTGISPLKIDHFVNGYTSGLGIALLSAFNPILRDTDPATLKTSEFSIVGGFFQPTDGTGVINKMYNDMQAVQEVGNTFKRLADEDPKKAQAYLNKYTKEIEQLSLAGAFRQEMGELNSTERAVRSDRQMSSEERRKFLDDIRKAKIELANLYREALNR